MRDEFDREVGFLEHFAQGIIDFGIELTNLNDRGLKLVRGVEATVRDISDLVERYESSEGETAIGDELKQIKYRLYGTLGGLDSAFIEMADELSGSGNPMKAVADVGRDLIRTSESLKQLAADLANIRIK